ncbi:hypothetical protein [Sphingomonas sp. UYP23]
MILGIDGKAGDEQRRIGHRPIPFFLSLALYFAMTVVGEHR